MAQRVLTAHVPTALAREVDALATRLDRPRGWVMKEAISLYVALERSRRELTLEAMAEVDAGHTVDHREIEAWVTSLPRARRKR